MSWTDGDALISTGSPFEPVSIKDDQKYIIGEANNMLAYPGICTAAVMVRAEKITDEMIVAGTKALSQLGPARNDDKGALLPDVAGE